MSEDLVRRVREDYLHGPRRGAKASGDDYDAGWKAFWARIRENAQYRANERAAKDDRNIVERRSKKKKRESKHQS